MECKKCGANISEASKFCEFCGEAVNTLISNEMHQNDEQMVTNNTLNEPIQATEETQQIQVESIEQTTSNNGFADQNIGVGIQPAMNTNSSSKNNKNGNKLVFIVLGIVLAAVAAGLVLISLNKSSNNSIAVLEKAIGNFGKNAKESGTINASVSVSSKSSDSINLSATVMYSQNVDNYDLNFKLNKSLLTDEINLYARANKDNISLYVNSKVVDMLGFTESNLDKWLTYSIDLEEFIGDEEIEATENINFKNIFDSKHLKFVDNKNNRHYKLIIDVELLEKIKNKASLSDEDKQEIETLIEEFKNINNGSYELDFYINNNDELVKFEMDLTKVIDDDDIESAIISIEFSDFNKTVVTIPEKALSSSMDIEKYITDYSTFDDDFDLDDIDNI